MLRLAAGAVLAGHGLIHLMGFVVAWQIATLEGLTYRTTFINGLLEVGDAGAQGLGIAWLLLAVAFLVAAYGVARDRPWAPRLTVSVAAASLVVTVLGLPDAALGLGINLAILASAAYLAFRGSRRVPRQA